LDLAQLPPRSRWRQPTIQILLTRKAHRSRIRRVASTDCMLRRGLTIEILRQRKGGLVPQIETQTLNLMRAAWKVTTSEEDEKRLEQIRCPRLTRGHGRDVHLAALPAPVCSGVHGAACRAARRTSRTGAIKRWRSFGRAAHGEERPQNR
jgi:hypothetical protein